MNILPTSKLNLGKLSIKDIWQINYYFLKAKIKFILANLRSEEPVFVYQMGKVASTSIVKALSETDFGKRIYHTHFLTKEGIDFFLTLKQKTYGDWQNIPAPSRYYIFQTIFLNQQLKKRNNNSKKKLKIITLVRDPIAINVSGFFHNQDLWLSDFSDEIVEDVEYHNKLKKRFIDEYPHEHPLTWFDRELKLVFGIDVFADSFPKSIGYKIYEGDSADVLLLKLESLDRCLSDAFKDFLNIDNFFLPKANTAREKVYSTLYKKFVANIQLPESYLKKMYNSKYIQHFYSESEINSFKAKWNKLSNQKSLII